MVRVEKVYKEKDYYKDQPKPPEFPFMGRTLLGQLGEGGILVEAFNKNPVKNALAVIGAITVLYIGFKFAGKFAKIKENLKRI